MPRSPWRRCRHSRWPVRQRHRRARPAASPASRDIGPKYPAAAARKRAAAVEPAARLGAAAGLAWTPGLTRHWALAWMTQAQPVVVAEATVVMPPAARVA